MSLTQQQEERKAEYLGKLIEAFNSYKEDTDLSPEALVDGSKLAEIIDKNESEFDQSEADAIAYIAQGLLAAVAEGLAVYDTEQDGD